MSGDALPLFKINMCSGGSSQEGILIQDMALGMVPLGYKGAYNGGQLLHAALPLPEDGVRKFKQIFIRCAPGGTVNFQSTPTA